MDQQPVDGETGPPRQPLLHDALIALRAPAQAWSRQDGSMGTSAIDGLYLGDLRLVDGFAVTVDGAPGEHISTETLGASTVRVTTLHRGLDSGRVADPDVRGELTREVAGDGARHRLELRSRLDHELRVPVEVRLRVDASPMDVVKSGRRGAAAPTLGRAADGAVEWRLDSLAAQLSAPGAEVAIEGRVVTLRWMLAVPARSSASLSFTITATDASAVVTAPDAPAPWAAPGITASADDRLRRWLDRALDDLDALRLVQTGGHEQFLAAGAPWFLTLFGRDSLWAARLLLPLDGGAELAASTLRALAELQGRDRVAETAEQPGKIMHELRSATLEIPDEGVTLPPLYYGTVDATPLWVCLLHDAWRAGMPDDEVRALLPHLEAALAWMRDFGDSDGDGLLEYVDETGTGLSNQGWKDSGDSVQWRDGRLAEGPIALCEVQAYAYEAAVHGAELLERFGRDGGEWRGWASRLRARFAESFWVADAAGRYPAIALDAAKRPVDSLTSNLGHLLGTGLLDDEEAALVAARLVSPELSSGFGLRTMSTLEAGYWPLSYHGGTVWTHDTAIAIAGLARDGFGAEARQLAEGLLAAAAAFDYRMPELHSGDDAGTHGRPAPYPAACRPQAWSAAAAVAVWSALS